VLVALTALVIGCAGVLLGLKSLPTTTAAPLPANPDDDPAAWLLQWATRIIMPATVDDDVVSPPLITGRAISVLLFVLWNLPTVLAVLLVVQRFHAFLQVRAHNVAFPSDVDAELERCRRGTQQMVVSTELATILLRKSVALRLVAVSQLLQEDAARKGGPLVSLSHMVEGKGPLLMALIEALGSALIRGNDSEMQQQLKQEALTAITPALPHVCALIRNSYDISLRHDEWDALSWLTAVSRPLSADDWPHQLASALLDRSCDVNARVKGRTPLLRWARGTLCCESLLLLLHRGADIDARSDFNGFTLLHSLAERKEAAMLKQLAEEGWLVVADHSVRNEAGETALELAQWKLAEQPHDFDRREICDVLRAQAALWQTKARPLLHRVLSHSLLIPDLADIVLDYMDGKEHGHTDCDARASVVKKHP